MLIQVAVLAQQGLADPVSWARGLWSLSTLLVRDEAFVSVRPRPATQRPQFWHS